MTFKEMRLNKGYTQAELSKKICVSKRTIEQFESNEWHIKNACFSTIIKICDLFNISIDEFCYEIFINNNL